MCGQAIQAAGAGAGAAVGICPVSASHMLNTYRCAATSATSILVPVSICTVYSEYMLSICTVANEGTSNPSAAERLAFELSVYAEHILFLCSAYADLMQGD